MGKMSKEKGKLGEREVAALLRQYGFEAKRGQQHCGDPEAPDVKSNMDGFHIEVKRVEAFRLWEALDQANDDVGEGDVPVVFHRKSRKPWVVIMEAEDFLELMQDFYRLMEDLHG
jgi:Holliday junction resolvase